LKKTKATGHIRLFARDFATILILRPSSTLKLYYYFALFLIPEVESVNAISNLLFRQRSIITRPSSTFVWFILGAKRTGDLIDVDAFAVSRETEPYEGARGRLSLMLLMKRFFTDLNLALARLLASAEILSQQRENLLLN
jgi:hypothetical protein